MTDQAAATKQPSEKITRQFRLPLKSEFNSLCAQFYAAGAPRVMSYWRFCGMMRAWWGQLSLSTPATTPGPVSTSPDKPTPEQIELAAKAFWAKAAWPNTPEPGGELGKLTKAGLAEAAPYLQLPQPELTPEEINVAYLSFGDGRGYGEVDLGVVYCICQDVIKQRNRRLMEPEPEPNPVVQQVLRQLQGVTLTRAESDEISRVLATVTAPSDRSALWGATAERFKSKESVDSDSSRDSGSDSFYQTTIMPHSAPPRQPFKRNPADY